MSHQDEILLVVQLAKRLPELGSFLDRVLADPILAAVFLLHRDELFQRQYLIEGDATIPLGTTGLPLMSHRVVDFRRSVERHAAKIAAYSPRWPRAEAERLQEDVQASAGERPTDAIVVAILNTIRNNPNLRDLVTGDEHVTRSMLRKKIRTYETLTWDGTQDDWAAAVNVLLGGHAGRAMRDLFLHVDLLKGIIDVERFRLSLLERTLSHWERLLSARRVKDVDWRRAILNLHQQCLVEHAGPLCLWCNHCPETGVTANVAASFVIHPVYCPRCRRPAYAATTFIPIPPLQQALELQDGVLGASIAWWLATHNVQFTPCKDVAGYEIDFVIPVGDDVVMVECKMNHVLDKHDLSRKLYENRNQLRDHVVAAVRDGVKICAAVCIVNITARELKTFISTMNSESEPVFTAVGAVILSYEEARAWLTEHAVAQ
jgi:hypothetical protein